MKASGILNRALLAMLLLLVEIEPGTSGGVNRYGNANDHQRTSVNLHCCQAS